MQNELSTLGPSKRKVPLRARVSRLQLTDDLGSLDSFIRDFQQGIVGYVADSLEQALLLP